MQKIIISLIVIVGITGATLAQNGKMGVGVQAGIGLPMGDFGDAVNTGFGATGTFFYGLQNNLILTGSIGFMSFSYDNETLFGSNASFSTVPVLFGGRYYFGSWQMQTKFYPSVELGIFFSSASVPTVTIPGVGTIGGGSVSSTDFGFSFGGGVKHPVSEKIDIDANIKYNIVSGDGWFTIMAGVDIALD